MIRRFAKRLGLAAGAAAASPALARRLLGDCGLIFMLHRFQNRDLGIPGHDPEDLRRSLSYLRGRGFELVSLVELVGRLVTGAPRPRGAIAFTIDDGYLDQAEIGAPVFAEFDCPVTTFVTTGFLDRSVWFWWDRITYVFLRTRTNRVRVRLGDEARDYIWGDSLERERARQDFENRCKTLTSADRETAIQLLAAEASVPLPARAPTQYAPMSWDMLRACESRGMSFGPHTVTHQVLSRAGEREAEREIVESWRRVRDEAAAPVAVFCYPNGQPGDYGSREMEILAGLGMEGSVVGTPGYARTMGSDRSGRFELPRYAWPDELSEVARFASGLERLRQLVRR